MAGIYRIEGTERMKKMQQAQPKFTTDAGGQQLAHVALANTGQRATLYAEDHAWLMGEGWSPYWSLTNTGGRHDYVLANARGPRNNPRTVTVARLIAQAAKGQRVTYADGDHTNLRRDNLLIVKGGGLTKAHARALRPCKDATPQHAPAAPIETPQAPAPRVVDVAALGQRVREQMAAQGVEVAA